MADFHAIAGVGKSIERRLNLGFAAVEPISAAEPTTALLAQTEDLAGAGTVSSRLAVPGVSILLYRVDVSSSQRAALSSSREPRRLPVDLYYLMTPWATNAEHEHAILGRTMQIMEETPSLAGPLLHPSSAWGPGETVQMHLVDLEVRDAVETFEALPVDFRLSVSYLASPVRIDSPVGEGSGYVDSAYFGLAPSPDAAAEAVVA